MRTQASAIPDNFASFDSNGGLQDSNYKAADFVQNITRGGSTLTKTNGVVDIPEEIQNVAATPVAAGGSPTVDLTNGTLTFGIPRGANGQNGADAYNPFKGTYLITDTLPTTGQAGDYIYVVDSATPPVTHVYTWNGTAFADSGETVTIGDSQFANSTKPISQTNVVNDFTIGGVDDVAGAESVRKLYLETIQKIDISSGNLINPNTIEEGKAIKNDGSIITQTAPYTSFITDYIPVKGQDIISNAFTSSSWATANIYNSELQLVATLKNNAQYTYDGSRGDAYIRFHFLTSNSAPMANYGTVLNAYKQYNPIDGYTTDLKAQIQSNTNSDIESISVENTLVGISNVKSVNLYSLVGRFSSGSPDYRSFVIKVKKGDVIKIKGSTNASTCCVTCVEYPSARTYISGETRYTPSTTGIITTITIPEGINYFLCGLHDTTYDVTPTLLTINGCDILSSVLTKIQEIKISNNTVLEKINNINANIGHYEVINSTDRGYTITAPEFIAEGTKLKIQAIDGISNVLRIYRGQTVVKSIHCGEIFDYTVPADTSSLYLWNSEDAPFTAIVGIAGNLFDINEVKDIKEYLSFNEKYTVNLFCNYNGIVESSVASSVIYKVKEGDNVSIKANSTGNVCWMFSDEYPKAGAYKAGFGRFTTMADRSIEENAPAGANYVMVSKIDTSGTDTTPVIFTINGYDKLIPLNEQIAEISKYSHKENLTTAIGQLYPIGTIESEQAATSNNGVEANYFVGKVDLNRKAKRDYFNTNIVAINHDDVSTEDLYAIRAIYNKYGFNGNFNFVLSASRNPNQIPVIKALSEDGNDIGLHAFLGSTAWLHDKVFDVRPDGTMTFYGDSFSSYESYILYTMDELVDGYDLDGNYIPANISQGGETVPNPSGKSILEWAEYYYNNLVGEIGYSTKGTVAEKFAADYTGTYPTKQQILDGNFSGCGHFTTGLFKDCCSCCNYEAWDRIMEVSIAYIRHFYGINNFTGCGPHGARYYSLYYQNNGFYYDDPDYNFLQNGQCRVYSSRLKAWTSLFDTFKRFGIKNCGNYSFPEKIELEAREGMYFGQKNIRSDFFDRPGLRANYLTLMGTSVNTPKVYTNEEFEKIFGDVDNWLKFAYENAGVEITKNSLTVTICKYVKNAIDRINYCKGTGKIPTLSFDTIWKTPACSVAFELICQYCYENDIELVPVEKARRLATSLGRTWQSNYYPNPAFTQTLLNSFGGSSTALSAYLPDGMKLLNDDYDSSASMAVSESNSHRVLSINGKVTANTKIYGLPEGTYKFSVNAKSTSGDATIKVYKRKIGDKVDDDTNTLISTISDLTSTFTLKEVSFDIPAPYRVPVDYTNPVSIISEGYENNVCIIEVRYEIPANGDFAIYEPKIELV